jgi:hypothetical protein
MIVSTASRVRLARRQTLRDALETKPPATKRARMSYKTKSSYSRNVSRS